MIRETPKNSLMEILKEAKKRKESVSELTPLDMLRNRRRLTEKRKSRRNLEAFIQSTEEDRK